MRILQSSGGFTGHLISLLGEGFIRLVYLLLNADFSLFLREDSLKKERGYACQFSDNFYLSLSSL